MLTSIKGNRLEGLISEAQNILDQCLFQSRDEGFVEKIENPAYVNWRANSGSNCA